MAQERPPISPWTVLSLAAMPYWRTGAVGRASRSRQSPVRLTRTTAPYRARYTASLQAALLITAWRCAQRTRDIIIFGCVFFLWLHAVKTCWVLGWLGDWWWWWWFGQWTLRLVGCSCSCGVLQKGKQRKLLKRLPNKLDCFTGYILRLLKFVDDCKKILLNAW